MAIISFFKDTQSKMTPVYVLILSDYNECLGNHHNCDVNALCANIAGSYNCFCKQGYTGDGFKCEKEGG